MSVISIPNISNQSNIIHRITKHNSLSTPWNIDVDTVHSKSNYALCAKPGGFFFLRQFSSEGKCLFQLELEGDWPLVRTEISSHILTTISNFEIFCRWPFRAKTPFFGTLTFAAKPLPYRNQLNFGSQL